MGSVVESSKFEEKVAVSNSQRQPGHHCCPFLLYGHAGLLPGSMLLPNRVSHQPKTSASGGVSDCQLGKIPAAFSLRHLDLYYRDSIKS